MSDVMASNRWQPRAFRTEQPVHAPQPTDVLIDSIAGDGRDQLQQLPVAVVYARLCAELRALGLEPAEAKVLRIANWISNSGSIDPSADAHAA